MRFIKLDTVDSTNSYCKLLDPSRVEEFTVVWTPRQTAGIGQRGSTWVSEPDSNIAMSIVLHPTFLRAEEQYGLTMAVAVAVARFAEEQLSGVAHPPVAIKWPNDIYVGHRKLCGILTESSISGGVLSSSICGIGLNVNQTTFAAWVPNPTSLALLTGRTDFDIEGSLLPRLAALIEHHYRRLQAQGRKPIEHEYLQLLLNRGVSARYTYKGHPIQATITGIDAYGHLCLSCSDGSTISSEVKEIVFM